MFQPASNTFGDPVAFRMFFEEAQDLANVEAILLRMDTDAPHPDDLNGIFRAVHSIKGGAAMLGCSRSRRSRTCRRTCWTCCARASGRSPPRT